MVVQGHDLARSCQLIFLNAISLVMPTDHVHKDQILFGAEDTRVEMEAVKEWGII